MSEYWLYRQLQAVDLAASTAVADIVPVAQLVARQQQTIRDLTVTVGVLAKMLVDAGLIDEDVMKARVEAGVEDMIEAAKLIDCISCHKHVPSGRTQITAAGPVCDDCTA